MAGIYKLEIQESEADLKQLLREQKVAFAKERVQLLYLLKTSQAKTVQQAAQMLGRNRVTVQEWLQRYRQGGLEQQPQGFESYGAICQWLETNLGMQAPYKTVHQLVHYRLNASPKIARPESIEQSELQIEAFKKT